MKLVRDLRCLIFECEEESVLPFPLLETLLLVKAAIGDGAALDGEISDESVGVEFSSEGSLQYSELLTPGSEYSTFNSSSETGDSCLTNSATSEFGKSQF